MIANLIGGFIAILLGSSLIGSVSTEVINASSSTNATGATCTYAMDSAYAPCQLYMSASWGASVLRLVPGFFALAILGVGVAVTYTSLRQAGIV
ncbi:MAG: hypothetical protein WC346_04520 [Methanogenium sp.]|jgi:hypothetical protein